MTQPRSREVGDPDDNETRSQRPARVWSITVGTNERGWLSNCFASLTEADTTEYELSINYIDNASTDGSAQLLRSQFPQVAVTLNSANLGFSKANNIGMAAALADNADYVLLVNPDTRTPPSLIKDLVRFMEAWPEYGVVGPMQYRYDEGSLELRELNDWSKLALDLGEVHSFWSDWPDHPSSASPLEGRAPRSLEHAYVQGAAMFVRTAALRGVGLFDEAFHTYYEETDLCRRMRWAGWRVALLLDLGIQHMGGGGAGSGKYRRVQMRRSRYYYLLTDRDWPLAQAARLAARWIRKDLSGDSVAGSTSVARGTTETVGAMWWLLCRLPNIVRRRLGGLPVPPPRHGDR